MTRLRSEDIYAIGPSMSDYDALLVRKTGRSLGKIAALAASVALASIDQRKCKVAVVPLTCGEGIIEGFSQAVAGIIAYLGFEVFMTDGTDAAGLALAVEHGADIVFQADEERFVAINFANRKTSDNSDATGRGFATAFELMCGSLSGRRVLLVGCGQVGRSAAIKMARRGAQLTVYDIDHTISSKLAEFVQRETGCRVLVGTNLDEVLLKHCLIFDASPADGFIKGRHLSAKTFIAAPGIPLGLVPGCWAQVEERTLHDPLQIGVATMLYDVCG